VAACEQHAAGTSAWESRHARAKRKAFFFEKKNQKTFARNAWHGTMSFLLLL
jgi:hypothetical protein